VIRIADLLGRGHAAIGGGAQRKGGRTVLHAEVARLGIPGRMRRIHRNSLVRTEDNRFS
jgi:hypothetical protein